MRSKYFSAAERGCLDMSLNNVQLRTQLHLLLNDRGFKNGVEVGVQKAEYSKYLLENTKLFMYLVDIWEYQPGYRDPANVSTIEQENYMKIAVKALQGYEDRYKIIRKYSVDAAKDFEDNSLDFVYLDAQHTWAACTADLIAWYPKVRSGGLMAGHDFLNAYGDTPHEMVYEVETAVREFIADKNVELHTTWPNEAWPTWYWIKP
jgi:hypothetical protein